MAIAHIRATDPEGFETIFTVESDTKTEDLLPGLAALRRKLLTEGYSPPHTPGRRKNGLAAFRKALPIEIGDDGEQTKTCPKHNATMQQRSNETGTWYSHKLKDGSWCSGYPAADKPKS